MQPRTPPGYCDFGGRLMLPFRRRCYADYAFTLITAMLFCLPSPLIVGRYAIEIFRLLFDLFAAC